MRNPFISVLLCTYNDSSYIKETIQSILAQTYKNFEFIIINDGSTDNTLDIVSSFSDPRIILVNKANSGLTDSLNQGVKIATGEWIARIDGDDIAYETRFEEQIRYLNSEIAVLGTQCEFIDESGSFLSKSNLALNQKKIVESGLSFKTMFVHPSTIINRPKLIEVGGYDPLIDAAEDLDLWLKLSTVGKLVNLDKPLLKYRLHQNKISNTKRKTQILNAAIAIFKYKKGLFHNISEEDYMKIRKEIQKNVLFNFIQNLSVISIGRKGILLKIINMIIIISFHIFNFFYRILFNNK